MRRLAGLLTAAVAAAAPATASGACLPAKFRPASVVLDAVALSGPAAPGGALASPAELRVLRYVRGRGPQSLRVTTDTLLAFHGVVATMSESVSLRAGQVVRVRLRGGDVRDLRARRVVGVGLCSREVGRAPGLRPRVIPRSETVAGEWRARVLRVPRGVRCLQLRRRSACEVLRGSRAAIVNRQVIGGQTALSAWGPRLRRVVVTRTGGPPVSAAAGRRPPLFVFGEVVEAFDLRVELHFAGGAVRVVQGDAARRVFAADPLTAGRWTAYSARVDGERCAVFDPVGFEGVTGDTCRRGAPDGFFATDARDPEGRVIVYGIAGARIAQVLVGTPSTTAELPRAERGGAFLAVVRGPVEPGTLTVTVRRTDGSVASYTAASGTF